MTAIRRMLSTDRGKTAAHGLLSILLGAPLVVLAIIFILAMTSGCSILQPPKPSITFVTYRAAQNTDGKGATETVPGDTTKAVYVWQTDATGSLVMEELYQDNPDTELLKERRMEATLGGTTTDAMLYGINQTDKAAATVSVVSNTIGAIATAGASEVPALFAQGAAAIGKALASGQINEGEATNMLVELAKARDSRMAEVVVADPPTVPDAPISGGIIETNFNAPTQEGAVQ